MVEDESVHREGVEGWMKNDGWLVQERLLGRR